MSHHQNGAELSKLGVRLFQAAYLISALAGLDDHQAPVADFEYVPTAPSSMDSVRVPPLLPDYPYMLNRNNYDLPADHTFAMFYPLLVKTLRENNVDWDQISQDFKIRCIAYPHNDKVEFIISFYTRPSNGRIIVEFHRYNGCGFKYAPLIHKIRHALHLIHDGEVSGPLDDPDFDDLNLKYVPTKEEVDAIISRILQDWPDSSASGLLVAESILAISGAEQKLMNNDGFLPAVLSSVDKHGNDTEVRRCAARVLCKIASTKRTALHLDVAAVKLIVDLMSIDSKIRDTLPHREVKYLALNTVHAIIKNNPVLIGELKKYGAEQLIGNLLNCSCRRVAEAARVIAPALRASSNVR